MRIEVIADEAGLNRLEARWNALYAADAQAQYFVSWSWIRHWFGITPYRWSVLAVQPEGGGEYVALLPLARASVRRYGFGLQRMLYMGGKPISDYAGFVADPVHADAAFTALGRYLAADASWDWFHVGHVVDPRVEKFLEAFQGPTLRTTPDAPVPCPYIALPPDWETYLATRLSHKGRFNLRRYTRLVEELPDFRATVTTPKTVDADLTALLGMWQARWGTLQAGDVENYRQMLRSALDDGALWLRMLWAGEVPIAGAAGFLDSVHRRFSYYIGGFNADFARYSPGKVAVGYAIRDAIEHGCTLFDFLLGGEDYKMDFFGAEERPACGATILRMDVTSRVRRRLARWLTPTPANAR